MNNEINGLVSALVNLVREYCNGIFDNNVKCVQTVIFKQKHMYYINMPNMGEIKLFEHFDATSRLLATIRITNLTVGAVSDCITTIIKDREKTLEES